MKEYRNYSNNYFLLVYVVFLIIIGGFIGYKYVFSKYEYELDLYPSEEYAYLDEVTNEIINEGVSIDLSALLHKKLEYKIENNNDTITLTIYSNSNTYRRFTGSPSVTIILSNDFRIISKTPNFSSESEYIYTVRSILVNESLLYGLIIVLIGLLVYLIVYIFFLLN